MPRRLLVSVLSLLAVLPIPALAGRNANGAMIVHTDDSYNWSNLTVCTTAAGQPASCDQANTMANRDADQVVWLLAAFLPGSSPGVTVIYFGIDYDDANLDPGVNFRLCGPAGSLEVPDDDWPYGGRGNSVAYGSPEYRLIFPFYAFRINGGTDGAYFCTAVNPTGGYAAFVDDSNPPLIDTCSLFGCVRWFVPGHNDCAVPPPTGACCFDDGSCQVLTQQDCDAAGGQYHGDAVPCDPNPCAPCWYACCLENGDCIHVCEDECIAQGGEFHVGFFCEPGLCEEPVGACCIPPCYDCSILTEADCLAQGGVWFPETPCDPNPCPEPPGACCLDSGDCVELTRAECAAQGGEHLGCGVPCGPDLCHPTPAEGTTWGRIRATYR